MPTPKQHANPAARARAYRQRKAMATRTALAAKGVPAAAPLPAMPSPARWAAMFNRGRDQLEALKDELQEYYDERSDQWREGERGEAMQAVIDNLEAALSELDGVDL